MMCMRRHVFVRDTVDTKCTARWRYTCGIDVFFSLKIELVFEVNVTKGDYFHFYQKYLAAIQLLQISTGNLLRQLYSYTVHGPMTWKGKDYSITLFTLRPAKVVEVTQGPFFFLKIFFAIFFQQCLVYKGRSWLFVIGEAGMKLQEFE